MIHHEDTKPLTLDVTCEGRRSVGHWFGGFFLPTLIGNILGGVPLVAAQRF